MALQLLESLDVYYTKSKRNVSLYSGDLSALDAKEAVDYMAVSTLPNFYLADSGTLLYSLDKKGVSVEALSKDKAVDYRKEIPCWISKEVKGIQSRRLLIFEPDNPSNNAYDLVTYIFSAISVYEQGRTSGLKIAIPMLCTGKSGADPIEMIEAIFFAAVHWGAMKFPFQEIKIVIYPNSGFKNAVRQKFVQLKDAYLHLESLYNTRAYSFYAKQAMDGARNGNYSEYLTQRQYYAIHLYTTNFYTTINSILRKNDRKSEEYKHMLPLFEALDTALMNLPPYVGMTYRGTYLQPEEISKHKVGSSYLNLAYTSTAYKIGGWYDVGNTCLDINGHTGSCIEKYSEFHSENEVLYVHGMSYKVLEARHDSRYYFKTDECVEKFRR